MLIRSARLLLAVVATGCATRVPVRRDETALIRGVISARALPLTQPPEQVQDGGAVGCDRRQSFEASTAG